MSVARRVAGAWNRFWFTDTDGLPLGLTRIGVAAAGWVLWAGTLPLLRHYYTDAGEFPISMARFWSQEYVARFLMPEAFGGFGVTAVFFGVWGLALAALLLGWRTRAAAWTNWLLAVWFLLRNPSFTNGGDEVFRLVSFYLALGYSVIPADRRALSLDRRRVARAGDVDATAPTRVPVWPVRMIQVQISIVYVVAGFWKVVARPWWDGSAMVYALDNSAFSRFGLPDWSFLQAIFVVSVVVVAWWEFLFPLFTLGRRTRLASLAFGVSLHGGILLFMSIGIFPFIMLGCYPVFLRADEVRWLIGRRRETGSAWPSAQPGPRPRASSSTSAPSGVVP